MMLSLEDVDLFFRLHRALMHFVDRRLEVTGKKLATPLAYAKLSPDDRIKVHRAFLGHKDLIDDFVAENPSRFDEDDLEIVRSWKDLVTGKFFAFRQLQNYMVFLTTDEPTLAYGVLALFDPFEEVIGEELPRLIETTLLPFKGMIVYDGLIVSQNIHFGPGIRRSLNEQYKEAKARLGIITALPFDPGPSSQPTPKPSARTGTKKKPSAGKKAAKPAPPASEDGEKIPAAARPAYDAVVALTDAFCRDHLDDEYAALSRKMAGVLARKRPSPLVRGKPASWASGIVRTIGWSNFLGDPSQPHHMKMTDIDKGFGVSEATGSNKSREIRDLLRINRFEADWTLPGRMGDNPLIWMLSVNGLLMDIRDAPRGAQEAAFKAGLIPYIPADREAGPDDD